MINSNNKNNKSGFTIVELLVVIVVIGILAAITIVSYTGITAKANTAAAQSDTASALMKIGSYNAESAYGLPTSFGTLTGAATSTSYFTNGINFTTASNNVTITSKPAANDAIDFTLCGTSGTVTAPAKYGDISVASGIKLTYWDQSAATPGPNSTQTIGTISGNYLTYPVACFKVGIAEATVAVAKAIYTETGSYPVTAAAIQANTASSAKLPAGLTVGITNPTSANGTTVVKYECGTAAAATLPCLTNSTGGGRITFWDYSLGTPAVNTITYGNATNYTVPAS